MKFVKDIFISYAHIDDEALIETQKGWVTEFHRVLSVRLSQLLGREPVIWRDSALQGNHIFDKEIVDQFAEVAAMISIITPRYTKSDWCLKEANSFYETCNKNIGFNVDNFSRIFKVIKTPISIDQQPETLRNTLGYEFYTMDTNSGRLKELSPYMGLQTEKFYAKLDDLALDIKQFIEKLEAGLPNKITTPIITTSNGANEDIKIYLSESSYETKEYRDSIRRELLTGGFKIYPDKPLPYVEVPLVEDVTTLIKESQLSIHIIGENYGLVPEGTQKSIVDIQNEVAAAVSKNNNLKRLIWIPEDKYPKEDRQIAFVNQLKQTTEITFGADIIQSSLEHFKEIVKDKLHTIIREKEKLSAATNSESVSSGASGIIYLICDILDLNEIKPLEDYLFNSGYEVMRPIFEGDETLIRQDHIENLKLCDAAIIFYGNANEIWLRSKFRDFLKINGYGREKPLNVKGIFLAGPPSSAKEGVRSQGMVTINGMHSFPEEELKSLLQKI